MKKTFVFVSIAMLNMALYFMLQIIAQFVHFFMYGEGSSSDKYIIWVSLFFVVVQLAILAALLKKRFIINSIPLYVVTTLTVIAIFIYANFVLIS